MFVKVNECGSMYRFFLLHALTDYYKYAAYKRTMDMTYFQELGLLFLLLGMGAIMFASLIYVFEKEDNDSTFRKTGGFCSIYVFTGDRKIFILISEAAC